MVSTSGRLEFAVQRSERRTPEAVRADILANPGFGIHFTDHMITAIWTPEDGWHYATVRPYAPFLIDPASAVLHYAQMIFEGLKAYWHADGSIWTFRPEVNGQRFARSARRLALPELPIEDFVNSIDTLIQIDHEWVPDGGETSLYIRPFMFASEVYLGVRPAREVTYCLIASPAGAYFPHGVKPVSIWLSEHYTRAAPGGTGEAKCGGNYAAGLAAQQEGIANGCHQVVYLDAVERRWVEELGGMNLYFVYDDGSIVTPELTGTILPGVTRSSIITLATDLGHKVEERRIDIQEWRNGVASGRITEVFACGTAAAVTPVGRLTWSDGSVGTESAGPITLALRRTLLDIQYGRTEDPYGWLHRVR